MMNPNSLPSADDQAGSGNGVPAGGAAGETNARQIDYQALYEELEHKLGDQGRELGEYRTFFEGISPLLDTLDKSPEMVQAIVDGKFSPELARAALDGKLTVQDINLVDKAHADVKKELGNKNYEAASVSDITRLVEEKVGEARREMQGTIRENEELQSFERKVNDFVDRTPDFPEYAREVEHWLSIHDDITDIEVAYYAVKGQLSARDAGRQAEEERAEFAKNQALSAGGGSSKSSYISGNDEDVIDSLIASRSNPNVF